MNRNTVSELPRATVVVACYNHAKFVETCLWSAFNQTEPVRVIVTDDGSSDETQKRVTDLLRDNAWSAQLVFHKKNKGICSTFNEALTLVATPYVAFISGDDWMELDRIAQQASALDTSPGRGFVYGDMYLANSNGVDSGKLYSSMFPSGWRGGNHENLLAELIRLDWIPAPSVLSRTEALRAVGGYDERLAYEDHDMWLRLVAAGWYPIFLPTVLVHYRQHGEQMSQSTNVSRRSALTSVRMLSKQIGHDPHADELIRSQLRHLIPTAYKATEHPRRIALDLLRAAAFTRSWNSFAFALLALSGIPAGWLRRNTRA